MGKSKNRNMVSNTLNPSSQNTRGRRDDSVLACVVLAEDKDFLFPASTGQLTTLTYDSSQHTY